VDTQALVEALAAGEIWGAHWILRRKKPLPADHPLFAMEKVIVLTHARRKQQGSECRYG
jgi:phosphoglycerate dehydrogenase-like enzyme